MLRIGLTGGMGSGKSTVARLFAMLGAPVYEADSEAKRLMNASPELIAGIRRTFGDRSYVGGSLDRGYIASRVFNDKTLLHQLNSMVHPAVGADFEMWAAEREADGFPYAVQESAILFESGFDRLMDYTVTVSAPIELRLCRAVARDGSEPSRVRERMANQMDDRERESRADYVIANGESDLLMPQVLELDKIFRK